MRKTRSINKIKIVEKKKDKLPKLISRMCESSTKPLEEWIYGKLNRVGSSGIITFKNQIAFNGYEGSKLNLCKIKYLYVKLYYIIVHIKNISQRYEIRQMSNNFYNKLSSIYNKPKNRRGINHFYKDSKIEETKYDNNKSLPALCNRKSNYIFLIINIIFL